MKFETTKELLQIFAAILGEEKSLVTSFGFSMDSEIFKPS